MNFIKLSSLNDNVTLRPHQESAVNFIDKNKKGILAHGTGLGKTLTSIAAFERLREKGDAGRALVIVPASLRNNYVSNIKKFTNSSYSVYGPKNEKNSKKVGDPSDSDYNIISYDLFRQDPQGIKDRLGADTLIIDEVHRARNESSNINRELSDHTPAYRNVITLTGSVVNNAPSDISPLMDATFGRSGNTVGTRGEFNRRYTTKVRKGGGFLSKRQEAFTTMNNRRQLAGALSGKVHYVSHNDLEQALPPIQEETVKVPMTDAQKKLYLYSFKDLPPMTKAKIRKNIPVSQKEMSSLFAKLMMSRKVMTDPASMDSRLEGQDPYMYSPKVKRVIDDMAGHLSESPRNKVVVYGNLLGSQIDTVKNVLDSRNVPYSTYFGTGNKGNNPAERDRNLKDYMSGKNRVLLISGAGGEGLDLKGTSMMQMLEGHYNPEKIQQAEARVRRMGDHPDKPIQIKKYVSTIKPGGMDKFMGIFGRKYPTSIDEYIYTVADRKDRLNQDFRDSLMKGAGLQEVFDKGKHDPRLRIDNAKFDSKSVLPINHDGDIVGFYRPTVSLNGSPRVGAIYVLPEYRRMGIAKGVVKEFYAKHPDMIYITTDTNKASQALAKSVGLQYSKKPQGNNKGMVFEKISAYNLSQIRPLMKSLKDNNIKLTRIDSLGSKFVRDSGGKAISLNIQRNEAPMHTMLHEFGHEFVPSSVLGPINPLNEAQRLSSELLANRAAAAYIRRTGGKPSDVKEFLSGIKPHTDTYYQGALKHTTAAAQKMTYRSPMDAVAAFGGDKELAKSSKDAIRKSITKQINIKSMQGE